MEAMEWSRRLQRKRDPFYDNVRPLQGTLTEKGTLMWGLVVGVWRRSVAASSTEKSLGCQRQPNRPLGPRHSMRTERIVTGRG